MKIVDGMRWGETELLKKEIENARFDADLLLAEVLKVTRDRLYLDWDRNLSEQENEQFRAFIQRRASNVPLQYILKRQEFMGLSFYVDERVLIPRPDSEILVEKWLDIVRQENVEGQDRLIKVADLCTGSGALAISIAHYYPVAEVVGIDLSLDALEVARQNAERLGAIVQWRQGDFVDSIRGECWDYIITNPPYVSTEDYRQCAPEIFHEPAMAFLGGSDGLDFYRRLAEEIRPLLKPQGKVLMEIGWDQAEAVCSLFHLKGFKTQVFPDLAGRDRVILAR
ncbi:peptide chain release factor N(5)-glutamine methyltransferase [Desulfosporosinus sp.]|uniref:peptide chain release factor N(5)-glutamine methyltransferase n=1 Tax=Desulfosporosinus sp. TaxID=157907 RepID=UPI002328ACDF|nr:peptide chain release factor N(5)-glutamine methyltransferase [Desulfosporosinus sp.]MCO5386160.1 peptide chain release factor N(5)-glutamine methyltransferase [Desulfosporosinus sp.]MDA8220466.1 peptide chain release factor N(5)-glutamine methyltransferase [Desulfitobacterium hafniense]